MAQIDIEVEGLREVIGLLDELDHRTGKKVLQKAVADSAKKVLKPKVKSATPWPSYVRAVRAGAAKREKPAGIVKYDAKRAPYRHIMIGGSEAHSTRRKRSGKSNLQAFDDGGTRKFSRGHEVSGVTGDPVITRIGDQYGDDALDHVEDYIVRHLELD